MFGVGAILGKEAWNAWRKQYPVRCEDPVWINHADFNEYNFRKERIDFKGFKFGDHANFTGALFRRDTRFDGSRFGNSTCFLKASFSENVSFKGAHFGDHVDFSNTHFGNYTSFKDTQFGRGALFINARFGFDVVFDSAQFDRSPIFKGAQFGERAHLSAVFGDNVDFAGAQFDFDAHFDGAYFGEFASFIGCTWTTLANEYAYMQHPEEINTAKTFAEYRGLSPGSFKSISFAGAKFAGQVDFSGREFNGPTSFGRLNYSMSAKRPTPDGNFSENTLSQGHPVEFDKAPLFHNCKFHQDTTFDGAKFPEPSSDPTENDTAARAYRTLKLAFSQHQATREEQHFFRLEMAEEATRAPLRINWLYRLYSFFSNYGFSLSRPTFLLLGVLPVFVLFYRLLAGLGLNLCLPWQTDCQIRYNLLQFGLLQSLPLPGLDKWSDSLRQTLFPTEGLSSLLLAAAVMLHKAISLLALFLFGLALRNLFKMK